MFTFSTADGEKNRNSMSLTSGTERIRDLNRQMNSKTDRGVTRDQIFSQ